MSILSSPAEAGQWLESLQGKVPTPSDLHTRRGIVAECARILRFNHGLGAWLNRKPYGYARVNQTRRELIQNERKLAWTLPAALAAVQQLLQLARSEMKAERRVAHEKFLVENFQQPGSSQATCEQCGKPMAKRAGKLVCSPKCRKARQRAKRLQRDSWFRPAG